MLTNEKYYNESTAEIFLGCIFRNLTLVVSQKYPVNVSLFVPEIHKLLFVVCYRLYRKGKLKALPYDIDNEVQQVDKYKAIYEKYNGEELVAILNDMPDANSNYQGYWNELNVFSTLRDLRQAGFATDDVVDLNDVNNYDAKSILDSYAGVISEIRTKRDNQFCREEITIGSHTKELLEQFKQTPQIGMPFPTSCLSTLTNGILRGTIHCISASSGTGKTNFSVSAICRVCVSHYWSFEENDFVENPDYDRSNGGALYVHSEMNGFEEIQPKFLASISGIDVKKITLGTLTPKEEERVLKAGRILEKCGIQDVSMPDLNMATVIEKATEIKNKSNLFMVVIDYIEATPSMIAAYRSASGESAKRTDQILLAEMTKLKAAAEELDIAVLTYTQTNGMEREMDFPDAGCIANFKSCQNKLDSGCVMLQTASRKKEMKFATEIMENNKRGFGDNIVPNIVLYSYKIRAGVYKQRLKIFLYFDYSICRMMDCLVMDSDNKAYEEFPWNEFALDGWMRI